MQTMEFVAGLTIEQALLKATKTAYKSGTTVEAVVNDIVMIVDKNDKVENLLKEYHQKHNLRCEIENVRNQR